MSSLSDKLKTTKDNLKNVKTRVTLETGEQICEKRGENGEFLVQEHRINATGSTMMQHAKTYGFVVDLKPDLQLAQVADGLFMGSQDVASELQLLKSAGITHVINAATRVKNYFPKHFNYLTLAVLDLPSQDLRSHFSRSNDFIRQAIDGGGKVFVHCNAGISRSSTIVLAYIIYSARKSLSEALEQVRAVRSVARPNVGFMQQLRDYELSLLDTNERQINHMLLPANLIENPEELAQHEIIKKNTADIS